MVNILNVIKIFYFLTFIILSYQLLKSFSNYFKLQNEPELYQNFKRKFISYGELTFFFVLTSISYFIIDIFSKGKETDLLYIILYAIFDIINGLLSPAYVYVFIIDDNVIIKMKNILCCAKKENIGRDCQYVNLISI